MELNDTQTHTVRRAFAYWDERWDWESPSLFGLTHEQYRHLAAAWPSSSSAHLSAAIGALRELLFGASALLDEASLKAAIGVDAAEGKALLAQLASGQVRRALPASAVRSGQG